MEEPAGPVLKKTEINSLAIQSRKALLLKGEKEAKISNAILHKVITSAIPEPVGGKLISLVNTRDEFPDLLKLDHVIGLLIPRGSNKLASQIKESAKIPVLGHTDGICHVHVEKSANLDMANDIFLDAKIDYPAACNAMDSSGILWDYESLASLLALELKLDHLFLLSADLKSKLIHTYVKEKHQGEITFGDKSRVGRGGATATVNAAVCAAYGEFPVVITCYATDNIKEVLRGDPIGTVFHLDAHLWTLVKEAGARDMAVAAQDSPRQLRAIGSEDRRNFLLDLADALDANEGEIIAEKEADVAAGYEKAMISRLALKPWKISALAKSISKLANSEQPFGRALKKTELVVTSVTESVFRDDAFQKQISEAAESLKKLRAVGTGKAPYEGLGYQDRRNILLDVADALSFHCASGSDGQKRGQGGMRQVAAGARGNRGSQGRKRSREDAQGGDRGKGRGRGQGAPAWPGLHGGPSKGRGIVVYKLGLPLGTVWMNECRNVGNLFARIQALRRVEWCDHMDFHMLDGTTFDEQGVVNAGWNIVRRNLVEVQVTSEADVEFDYGAAAAGDDVVRVTVKRELLANMEALNAYLISVSYMKPTDSYRFLCGQLDAETIVYTFQVADPDGGALENLDRNDFNHRTSTQDDWYEVVGRRLHKILARW